MTPFSPERLGGVNRSPRYRTARRARPDPRLSSAATKHCPQLIFLRDEAYQGSHRCEGETACGWRDRQLAAKTASNSNKSRSLGGCGHATQTLIAALRVGE